MWPPSPTVREKKSYPWAILGSLSPWIEPTAAAAVGSEVWLTTPTLLPVCTFSHLFVFFSFLVSPFPTYLQFTGTVTGTRLVYNQTPHRSTSSYFLQRAPSFITQKRFPYSNQVILNISDLRMWPMYMTHVCDTRMWTTYMSHVCEYVTHVCAYWVCDPRMWPAYVTHVSCDPRMWPTYVRMWPTYVRMWPRYVHMWPDL